MKSWKSGRLKRTPATQRARNWMRRKAVRMGLVKRDWSTSRRRYESDKV